MKISVVIAAYNEAKGIGKTLESLEHQTIQEPFEVIVVDNNSTDDTAVVAASYANRLNVKIITEPIRGRGAARAAGFAAATGEIICSTDADTKLPPHWLERITAPLQNPKYVAAAGSCKIEDSSPFENAFFNIFQPTFMGVYGLLFGHVFLSGFSFAIRREVYQKSGGFTKDLNALEDADLGFKVRKIGKIKFVRNSPVITSGRRFKGNLVGGLFSYVMPFVDLFVLRRKQAYLKDIRN